MAVFPYRRPQQMINFPTCVALCPVICGPLNDYGNELDGFRLHAGRRFLLEKTREFE